jgi:hypothetical protein
MILGSARKGTNHFPTGDWSHGFLISTHTIAMLIIVIIFVIVFMLTIFKVLLSTYQ